LALGVPKVSIVHENLRFTSTESKRRYSNCSVLPTEDVIRSHGQGYSINYEKITINALWERLCWSLYVASTVRRVDLEAENYSSLFLKMLMESNLNVQSYIINFNMKNAELVSIICKMAEFMNQE
jgi:hypothetical protein